MHAPIELEVSIYDDVGGVLVYMHTERQVRCGCTHDLRHDWGHHERKAS